MRRRVPMLMSCLLTVLAGTASAQILTGNIIGTVRDESGAVLPGVTVTLTSPTALPGGSTSQVTNDRGEYRFTQLNAGTYDLTATLTGFTTYEEPDLRVGVGGTTERAIALKLATVAETV